MTIRVTPMLLATMCGDKFSCEAIEAICDFFEECPPEEAPTVGDICVCFSETDCVEDYDNVIAELSNGNYVIAM